MTLETCIAEVDSFGVQVQTSDFMATLCQRIKQATCATGRFEKLFGGTLHVLAATAQNKLDFSCTVSPKYQVIVLGVIVDRFVDCFD